MAQVAIHRPTGEPIDFTVGVSRKAARITAATHFGVKWHTLWKRGFRCRALKG